MGLRKYLTWPRKEPLRDTGHAPRYPDEQKHMSTARRFDDMVGANMRAIRAVYHTLLAIAIFAACSAYSTHVDRQEMREQILSVKKACSEKP